MHTIVIACEAHDMICYYGVVATVTCIVEQ